MQTFAHQKMNYGQIEIEIMCISLIVINASEWHKLEKKMWKKKTRTATIRKSHYRIIKDTDNDSSMNVIT